MQFSHRGRDERLICAGRVALAAFSLVALSLNPPEPAVYREITIALLTAYAVYAAAVTVAVARVTTRLREFQLVTHGIDLAAFGAVVFLTEGATSPFLVYLVFALVAATLRWQWKGAAWTAGAILTAFAAFGVYSGFVYRDSSFEPDHFVILGVDLIVVGVLLAVLGWHQSRLHDDMDRLATWARESLSSEGETARLRRMLEQAANAIDSRRAVLVWEEGEEPWWQLAYWDGATTELSRVAPTDFSPLVAPELDGTAFLCAHVGRTADAGRAGDVPSTFERDGQLGRYLGSPVNRALAERFEMDRTVSVPVEIEDGAGRMFLLDGERLSTDDLTLARIVGRAVSAIMAEILLRGRMCQRAIAEERRRLAQDLHDGVLQSLTGSALQLETARRLLTRDVAVAGEAIEGVQRSLVREQRDLRMFVDALAPGLGVAAGAFFDLRERMGELRESVSHLWGLDVDVILQEEPGASIASTDGLANDVMFIVHEGLVNSARHSRAARAWATVQVGEDRVDIEIEDDGCGFAFEGRRDTAALQSMGVGPRALMRRVDARGGTLTVDSSTTGSRVAIRLPMEYRHCEQWEVG